jgi:hypothetical protein
MLRSPPCPKGEVGVSKYEAAPSFETAAPEGGCGLLRAERALSRTDDD